MKEELTTKMHSEFTIDAETEIKHKAFCVWDSVGIDATESEIKTESESYGITPEDALKWKDYFFALSEDK